MDRAESPGVFRAAAPVSGSRPGGTNRRGFLRADSDCHSAGRPVGTAPADGRLLGTMVWAAPEGRLVGRTRLGTTAPRRDGGGWRGLYTGGRLPFSGRRIRAAAASRCLHRRGLRQDRESHSRPERAALSDPISPCGGYDRVPAWRGPRAPGRAGGHGRRLREIRRLAWHIRLLLPRRLARTFLHGAGGQCRVARDVAAGRIPEHASATWPRRPAHRLVHRNDGVGAAHCRPGALPYLAAGVWIAVGRAAIPTWRFLARLLQQVRGSEPASQKDALRFGEDPAVGFPTARGGGAPGTGRSHHAPIAVAAPSCLLAPRLSRGFIPPPSGRGLGRNWGLGKAWRRRRIQPHARTRKS